MIPSFLITLREVIEAMIIVTTLLGIAAQLKWNNAIKAVWIATLSAGVLSIILVSLGSIFGFQLQKLYVGKIEQVTEGILMTISAIFITWTVFFLHRFFSQQKGLLLKNVKKTIQGQELKGLFILVFTAVFREGFEIALFLTSIYLSASPKEVAFGFIGGLILGILVSVAFFKTSAHLPVKYAFRTSTILLVLFAAGLFSRGTHEFMEAKIIPELFQFSLPFISREGTFMGDMIQSVFGIAQKMDIIQICVYLFYTIGMGFYLSIISPRRSSDLPQ
jgi:high-affinity iron transporter